ncbi:MULTISPECIES: phosphoribosylanthranilate isomerase [Methylobacterium]|jgi:phosphoribosylanthranilate isomerase|uniref:N-(5'-phosphoribosyl)anthranilate isomerase n=1 Tax=Methylobacterium longum TaxID=767694 RepID=A0ABT8AMF0_9HYPH|nr:MULTISPECIES: phosphoribosylanthranilate isomerase [Methylobacterium]MCJ2102682.1 phosphoribosylanthranilate isomerase [Methylobacterium sp. E-046]MDN3571074.1 phosphoribosylanthranilate isomerase [Methylobacterium longum]GJE13071.1 N-(5'-phosphoribosyl)anthranilate isomerase [Methylobacterium longum]
MASESVTPTRVKICGLSTEATLTAALEAGADWIGLVHFPRSPRHVALTRAAALSDLARGRAERVILLVDPDDALVAAAVAAVDPDLIQLHGRESPERVAAIRARTGRPVMKALGIGTRADLSVLPAYAAVADRILLDAKAPPDAALPGGNGRRFDWELLRCAALPPGTMLSGGLDAANVAEALARTGIGAVDVSSGVESAPGAKDADKIAAFVAAARVAR